MSNVHVPGACSMPGCPHEPPKDNNPFCHAHWAKVPGRLRKRIGTIWKSRTKSHHGKQVKGAEWDRAVAEAVRALGGLPRNELPRSLTAPTVSSELPEATRQALAVLREPGAGDIDHTAAQAIRDINRPKEATVPHSLEPVATDQKRERVNRRIQLEREGEMTDSVRDSYRDFLLDRYMADLPKPTPEEIYLEGLKEGIRRERERVAAA